MKKRGYFIFALFVLIFLVFTSSAGVDRTKPYHNSNSIIIGIDGLNKSINEILATNFIFPSHLYTEGAKPNPGHSINETWVSVKDGEMTLLKALNSTNRLCPLIPAKTSYSSSPSDKSKPFHYATEINLSSGKTLQEAINAGDLCYYWRTNSTCSATCGGGTNMTYCSRNGIIQVADSYCYAPKPSKSCNTRGCVWALNYSGCIYNCYNLGPCSPEPTGTPCSPSGSRKICCYGGGCGANGGIFRGYVCQ